MTADIWLFLIPLYILTALLIVLGLFALLGRDRRRQVPEADRRLPDEAAARRQGDAQDVASRARTAEPRARERGQEDGARRRRQRSAAGRAGDLAPVRAGTAAYLDATTEQADAMPMNRQMKRQMERAKKGRRRSPRARQLCLSSATASAASPSPGR
jgi:hypothetical protein